MTKELQKKEEGNLVQPDYLKEFKADGAEDISADMVEKSFILMAHSDDNGYKIGDFYDSLTSENYGNQIVITICKISRSWRRFNDDFKLDAISSDGMFWDNGEKLTEDEKWQTAFIDLFVILNDKPSAIPYIISLKGTSYRTGKKLSTTISKFTRADGEPIYGRNYTLYTEKASKGPKAYAIAHYKINPGFNSKEVCEVASKVRRMVLDVEADVAHVSEEISEGDDLD